MIYLQKKSIIHFVSEIKINKIYVSVALIGKMMLVRIIGNNKIDAYFSLG